MFNLDDGVKKLHLVDEKAEKALARLGVKTIRDLLYYFPRDWQDQSEIGLIKDIRAGEQITIKARVKKLGERRTKWRRMSIIEGLLEDETGSVLAIWFNQPFLKRALLPGKQFFFHGKGQIYSAGKKPRLQLSNPAFEPVKTETIHTAGIIPIYDLTEGVTQKQLRYWLKQALPTADTISDHLPDDIRSRYGFPLLPESVRTIHFPHDLESLKISKKRLAFDEIFLFQLSFLIYKQRLKSFPAPPILFDKNLVQSFVAGLPFRLTNSQRLAVWEILQDMENGYPMNRLLEGEVGSGKTVVAGIGMLQAASRGWQSVLLAPTEILAFQHYQTLKKLFERNRIGIGILTRSHKQINSSSADFLSPGSDSSIYGDVAAGKIKIIVGTHALLQEKVKFQRIGLLVVDEQHRFGVKQRGKLQATEHGVVPHLLSMSATPIPRTLALSLYGDLDISRLTQLPSGRKKIITSLIDDETRPQAYEFIKKEIQNGRQGYIITALVDESDKNQVKSAVKEAERLQKFVFPDLEVQVLHGRMKGEEKKRIMDDFKNGKTHILVSTTVIEVGVDVPNTTVILIENAERFGLAQLHQLRGRVGRSDLQSYCFLHSANQSPATRHRLEALLESNNGFELAEIDLKLRGPGEMLGTKQSGYIPFKIADLRDHQLIKTARKEAEAMIKNDSKLKKNAILREKITELAKEAHLE